MSNLEFDRRPVSPDKLESGRYFAASYAGEHVAGTEFVIGAMFVSWGVATSDILLGLFIGNLFAVLTWALVCAPIAVDTRLTLYAYLEKIAGPGTIKIYSVVNGILFCVLAGAMITVSASAIRILFNLPPQVNWYPEDLGFVVVALAVGTVVVYVAVKGFKQVAKFAEVCAPWMILMFIVGAVSALPTLISTLPSNNDLSFVDSVFAISDNYIWKASNSDMNWIHVAAFAWLCNFAMHGGMSDMTILRFAKKAKYGYFSSLGMFIGHFLAWICAGIMGAGAALMLKTQVTNLDAGEVAFQVLGGAGIIAVIIAGWTTSNPTIYRAGLAFQSLNPRWNRKKVTTIVGIATTIIACFPFVFTKLMDFVSLMALALAPIGAIIFTEHWLINKLGMTRYWSNYKNQTVNLAAVITWGLTLVIAYISFNFGIHSFFLPILAWFTSIILYIFLAKLMGASDNFAHQSAIEEAEYAQLKQTEREYLQGIASKNYRAKVKIVSQQLSLLIAMLSLITSVAVAVALLLNYITFDQFKTILLVSSIVYFVSAFYSTRKADKNGMQPIDYQPIKVNGKSLY